MGTAPTARGTGTGLSLNERAGWGEEQFTSSSLLLVQENALATRVALGSTSRLYVCEFVVDDPRFHGALPRGCVRTVGTCTRSPKVTQQGGEGGLKVKQRGIIANIELDFADWIIRAKTPICIHHKSTPLAGRGRLFAYVFTDFRKRKVQVVARAPCGGIVTIVIRDLVGLG
jgi:hypothetical protein